MSPSSTWWCSSMSQAARRRRRSPTRSRPPGRSCSPCSTRRSRVTVIGFGGVNHVVPNENPTTWSAGPPSPAAANLGYLASCVNKLHRRTETEGDDTDYAAALGQAMSYFNPGTSVRAAVPVRGDQGHLDDDRRRRGRAPRYPAVRHRLAAGRAGGDQPAAGRRPADGVQVWPLGFGTDIGTGITEPQAKAYLNQDRRGNAAPAVCDKRHVDHQPHATWVNKPPRRDQRAQPAVRGRRLPGHELRRTPRSAAASRPGKLTVTSPDHRQRRGDQRRPRKPWRPGRGSPCRDGRPWTDSSAISGQDTSPVEVLHIANITSDEVGTWGIHLTAPAGAGQPAGRGERHRVLAGRGAGGDHRRPAEREAGPADQRHAERAPPRTGRSPIPATLKSLPGGGHRLR